MMDIYNIYNNISNVFLKMFLKGTVDVVELKKKWKNLCLPMEQLHNLLQMDNFVEGIEWMKFFALGCSSLGGVCRLVKVILIQNKIVFH